MYALTTHASDVCEKPRSARIDGSATFTIVVSSTIIRLPRHSTTSAVQRVRLSRSGPSAGRWVVVGVVTAILRALRVRSVVQTGPPGRTHRFAAVTPPVAAAGRTAGRTPRRRGRT